MHKNILFELKSDILTKRQRKPKGQSRIDNHRSGQHWVHKTQDEERRNKKHHTEN